MGAAPLKWLAKIGGDALDTTATTISAAINELVDKVNQCFQSVSDGKSSIATALTNLGVTTSSDATFATIVDNIKKIKPSSATLSNAGALSVKDVNGTEVYKQSFTNSYDAGVTATKKGTAGAAQVLTGYTFTNASSVNASGSMANQGTKTYTINPGGSQTIPAGYHSGSGKVTANANQNSATYTYAANSTGGTVDMGANNTYRYVNAGNVYNKGKADGINGYYKDISSSIKNGANNISSLIGASNNLSRICLLTEKSNSATYVFLIEGSYYHFFGTDGTHRVYQTVVTSTGSMNNTNRVGKVSGNYYYYEPEKINTYRAFGVK